MSEIVSLRGGFGPVAEELARLRVKDFTPVMEAIKQRFMEPMAHASWAASGLHSRTGELEGAITPFSGKVSAGVGVRTTKGRDLVLPKAIVHTYGRKKWASKRGFNRKTKQAKRRSPWGDIPARPFIPQDMPAGYKAAAEQMIVDFINDRLGKTR